jgi:hypothetical protein
METKGLRAKRFPYPAPWGGTFLIITETIHCKVHTKALVDSVLYYLESSNKELI